MIEIDELAGNVTAAHRRISRHVRRTPVERSPWLSEATGADVWLKLENYQLTGSFKLRGATNRVLTTPLDQRRRGFVAASTGNHGAALAHAAAIVEAQAVVFVPTTAEPAKVERLRAMGVEVRIEGGDGVVAERAARAFAAERELTYVSPYNDAAVIAGQGTVGLEIDEQIPRPDTVVAALGGGGLVAGTAAFLKRRHPELLVMACSPSASAVMIESLHAGEILNFPSKPTLSDGTAGGVEEGAITFELCRRLIDRRYTVSESEIAGALRDFIAHHHSLIEGAAAVAVATVLRLGRQLAGRRVALVLCGANIGAERLREALGTR